MTPKVFHNARWAGFSPQLSVLVPFYRSDPLGLVRSLRTALTSACGAVELILADDGGQDPALIQAVQGELDDLEAPAALIVFDDNLGRARIRNRLAASARGPHLLLLDCDMAPAEPTFLRRWLVHAAEGADVAFGGFLVPPLAPADARYRFHHALQTASEALDARARAKNPAKFVFTSNLLVRRDLLLAEPFDEGFTGWGWEDVDWGLRIAKTARIDQIDNPALHLGLDEAATVLGKYAQSPANFARMLDKNPAAVRAFPLVQAAERLKRLPGLTGLASLAKALAGFEAAPMRLRILAAKIYRASLYVPALRAASEPETSEDLGRGPRRVRQDEARHAPASVAKG